MKIYKIGEIKVIKLDEEDDKSSIDKLKAAYQIIWNTVPINEHGRLGDLLVLETPSEDHVIKDFIRGCTLAKKDIKGANNQGPIAEDDSEAILNEAEQICWSIRYLFGHI